MPFFRKKIGSGASSKTSSPLSTPSPKSAMKTFPLSSPSVVHKDIGPPSPLLSSGSRSRNSTPGMSRSTSYVDQLSGDLGSYCLHLDTPMPAQSRLSKSLQEVLNNKDALGYFIQFMEFKDAGPLIRFWLDAESFQAATWTRIRSHSLNALSHSSIVKTSSPTKSDEDSAINDASKPTSPDILNHMTNSPPIISPTSDDMNCQSNTADSPVYLDLHNDDALGEKLRKSIEKDAVAIYSRYISQDAAKPIGISDQLRNETIRKICCEDGRVDPLCFVNCQTYVYNVMERDYIETFTRSAFHCQHQIDFLTSGEVRITDFLYNDTSMFYFTEFMEVEGGSSWLQFLMCVDNFEKLLTKTQGGYDGVQAQEDAMVLYDKYFSLQATSPLGFDDRLRFEIESNICREDGPLPACFHSARSIVLAHMDKKYFKHFLSSEIYFKYLSELIAAIQSSHDVVQGRRRRASDASSEHSQGAQSGNSGGTSATKNTLLATDSTSSSKRVVNLKADDFRIDMGSIINPQSLWQRNNSGNLQLGHVNSMGHFVSNFDREPEHGKKSESYFSRKRKDQEKMQEEAALKIAQMIINDVTSITALDDEETAS